MSEGQTQNSLSAYELTRFNATRHGVLSTEGLLPWQDPEEHQNTLEQLISERMPQGLIESHLVVEIRDILWRKRRLRLAEAAAYRRRIEMSFDRRHRTATAALVCRGLPSGTEQVIDAVYAPESETAEDIQQLKSAADAIHCALATLHKPGRRKYAAALSKLNTETREAWEDALKRVDETTEGAALTKPCAATGASLADFLENEVDTWIRPRISDLENRKHIKVQAFGEAFDPDTLERLARYETHLDRKLERTIGMLLRVQQLRSAPKSVSQLIDSSG